MSSSSKVVRGLCEDIRSERAHDCANDLFQRVFWRLVRELVGEILLGTAPASRLMVGPRKIRFRTDGDTWGEFRRELQLEDGCVCRCLRALILTLFTRDPDRRAAQQLFVPDERENLLPDIPLGIFLVTAVFKTRAISPGEPDLQFGFDDFAKAARSQDRWLRLPPLDGLAVSGRLFGLAEMRFAFLDSFLRPVYFEYYRALARQLGHHREIAEDPRVPAELLRAEPRRPLSIDPASLVAGPSGEDAETGLKAQAPEQSEEASPAPVSSAHPSRRVRQKERDELRSTRELEAVLRALLRPLGNRLNVPEEKLGDLQSDQELAASVMTELEALFASGAIEYFGELGSAVGVELPNESYRLHPAYEGALVGGARPTEYLVLRRGLKVNGKILEPAVVGWNRRMDMA